MTATTPVRPTRPLAARFFDKFIPEPNSGCWLWLGSTFAVGYGAIGLGRRTDGIDYAHRVSWDLHFGAVPDGMWVLHRCDVRICVNPRHLFLGTPKANSDDMRAKGRARYLHQKGEAHGNSILTDALVLQLRAEHRAGDSLQTIATRHGLNRATVHNVVSRGGWKHLEES